MKKNIKKINLIKKHLLEWGLYSTSSSSDYLKWTKLKFNKNNISETKINNLCDLEDKMKMPKYTDTIKFYDFIAQNETILKVVHSGKFHEIVVNGYNILNSIKKKGFYLDLGCNAGYLTSFYANYFKNSTLVGFDTCKKSIDYAKKSIKKKKNLNYFFKIESLKKYKFDYVFDTQCLCNLIDSKVSDSVLYLLKNNLHDDGAIISISCFNTEKDVLEFINNFKKFGFFINELSPILFDSLHGKQALTKIIFIKRNNNLIFDINAYFNQVRKKTGT